MIKRVVVPMTTTTTELYQALLVAPTLARWAGASVELLSVVRPDDRPDIEPLVRTTAEQLRPQTAVRIVESGGPIGAVLVTELRRSRMELWCVGSHGRSALGELVRDSISEELVRQAHVPIILAGPSVVDAPLGRVMDVALDGTANGASILGAAADLAVSLGMTLRLLQVSRDDGGAFPADASETSYLTRVTCDMTGVDPATIDFDVLHGGHPARQLVDDARRRSDVGMIALATRGLDARQRLLDHSTTFEVARHAPVPVLAVHHVLSRQC